MWNSMLSAFKLQKIHMKKVKYIMFSRHVAFYLSFVYLLFPERIFWIKTDVNAIYWGKKYTYRHAEGFVLWFSIDKNLKLKISETKK